MDASEGAYWKKCSSCKKPIGFNTQYYICSVSTCNGQRTGYVFCSLSCFEVHLPGARHRDAGGIRKTSPQEQDSLGSVAASSRRIIVSTSGSITSGAPNKRLIPKDILIVASKLKDYIQARSEMNTSAAVMEVLSDIVRRACDDAIDCARADGRKTVLDRDFKK
jgi:histone H3/H4